MNAKKRPLKTFLVIGISAIIAITLFLTLFSSIIFAPKYNIDVDVVQSGLTIKFIKIKVTNSGTEILTDVKVSFDQNEVQNIGTLNPGQAVWLTPDTKVPTFVRVSTSEGIEVVKRLRVEFPYSP